MDAIRLESGREIRIRPIRPDDACALSAAYERLSTRSQYQRFMGVKPRLSAADGVYLTQLDGINHFALVATPVDRDDWILAVGRFVRSKEDPTAAEFAITVGDPYQREGIGTELVERLSAVARERGITRFTATMLAENLAAHRLTHRLARGLAIERHSGSVDEIEAPLLSVPVGAGVFSDAASRTPEAPAEPAPTAELAA